MRYVVAVNQPENLCSASCFSRPADRDTCIRISRWVADYTGFLDVDASKRAETKVEVRTRLKITCQFSSPHPFIPRYSHTPGGHLTLPLASPLGQLIFVRLFIAGAFLKQWNYIIIILFYCAKHFNIKSIAAQIRQAKC